MGTLQRDKNSALRLHKALSEADACLRLKPTLQTPQTTEDWREDYGVFSYSYFLSLCVFSPQL